MGGLDDVGKDLDVAIDRLAELFAWTAAGVDRHRLEFVAHPRIGRARRDSVPSLLATAGGVPAGTNKPLHRPIFTSG